MKRWLKSSRIWALCLAAILLIGIEIPVQASPESGTLKVHLKENRFRVEFAVYKVAEYTDGEYPLTSDFAGINDKVENAENRVDLNKLTNASQMKACAEKLIKWADEKNISPMYQAYTEDGVLDLGEVPLGMFLVRQISHKEDQILVTPALLGVPYWKVVTENGEQHKVLEYTVESEPKESVEIPETEKPPVPEKPSEPGKTEPPILKIKTGDISKYESLWYLLVLVSGGVMVFTVAKRKQGR